MMRKNSLFRLLFILLLTVPYITIAQVNFSISSTEITTDEGVHLKVSFKGGRLHSQGFESDLTDFQVVGNSSYMVNDHFEQTITLIPRRTGTLQIPAWIVNVNGKSYKSKKYTIQVKNGAGNKNRQQSRNRSTIDDDDDPWTQMMQQMQDLDEAWEEMIRQQQARRRQQYEQMEDVDRLSHLSDADPAFVDVQVNKKNIYVGEPIEVSYTIYNRLNGSSAYISKLPQLKGFYSKDYDIPRNPQGKRSIVGNHYYTSYLVKKTVLYPTQSGTLVIDPLEFTLELHSGDKRKFNSKPIQINVKSLPPAPENFKGAVGDFSVIASIDKSQISTDDIATLRFTVKGAGNLDLIQAPEILLPDNVHSSAATVEALSTQPSNEKTFLFKLNVDEAGLYTIPAIAFTYFSPGSNSYINLMSEPLQLEVTLGKGKPIDTAVAPSKEGEMQDIIRGELPPNVAGKPFWTTGTIIAAWLLALGCVPMIVNGKRFFNKQYKNYNNLPLNPEAIAQARLAQAKLLLNDPNHKHFYDEVSKSIWLFLSDSLKLPLHQLNKENLQQKLQLADVPASKIADTLSLINTCEMALYSPFGVKAAQEAVLEAATQLLAFFANHFKS